MKKLLLVTALSLGLIIQGCSLSSAISQLEKYAPIAIQAIESIVAVLVQGGVIKAGGATVIDTDVNMASASLQDVENAVAAYNNAPASEKSSKIGAVITALEAAQSELAQGIKDIGLNGNSNAALASEAGLQVIITTLGAIEVNLPQSTTKVSKAAQANASKAKLSLNPFGMFKNNYASQFKVQFNAPLVRYGFPQYQLK